MGDCALYKCGCGYEKRLAVGAGRNSMNLRVIGMSLPPETFADFSREQMSGGVSDYALVNSVISCPECGSLNTVTDFFYAARGGGVRYVAPCPECGKERGTLKDTENVPCPRCGKTMTRTVTGLWD